MRTRRDMRRVSLAGRSGDGEQSPRFETIQGVNDVAQRAPVSGALIMLNAVQRCRIRGRRSFCCCPFIRSEIDKLGEISGRDASPVGFRKCALDRLRCGRELAGASQFECRTQSWGLSHEHWRFPCWMEI